MTLTEEPIKGVFTLGRAFVNASSDALRFNIKKKLLGGYSVLDPTKTVVCSFSTKLLGMESVYHVYAGKKSDDRNELFEVGAHYGARTATKLQVTFQDVASGETCKLSFGGHWRNRNGLFWLRKGTSERLDAVAKVFCPESTTRDEYQIEIAPNVDTATAVSILADRQMVAGRQMANTVGSDSSGGAS